MKQLKISILTILILITSNCLKAQDSIQSTTNKANPIELRLYVSRLLTHIKSDVYDYKEKDLFTYNVGVDFMYYYFKREKFRAKLSLGIGLTNYQSSFDVSYEHSAITTDVDGQVVSPLTEIVDNMTENLSLKFLDIPIKLSFEFNLSQKMDAYITVGTIYGLALKGTYSNEALITRTGYYPAYNALIYDVDVEGSPFFYPSNKKLTGDDEINIKNNVSFETSLGIKCKISSKIAVLAGIKYMLGLTDIVDGDNPFIVKNDPLYNYSLNSLSERGDELRSSAFGFEIGVQIVI